MASKEGQMEAQALQRPPGYELFFAPLEVELEPNDLEMIQCAYFLSKYGHAKQVRDDGSRYFDHPKGVAWIYINELGGRLSRAIVGMLLHDLSEDTYLLSGYRIARNFTPEIALDVRAMTKLPKGKEDTAAFLRRNIEQGPYSILGKLCDRCHNNRTLGTCTEEKRARQIEETVTYHLPMLVPALKAHGGLWAEHAQLLENKIQEALEFHSR